MAGDGDGTVSGGDGEGAVREHVELARGAAAELGERLAAGIVEWSRRRGLDAALPISALVVLTVDGRRARDLRLVVEAVIGSALAQRIAEWRAWRCVAEPAARTLTLDLHRDYIGWLRLQGLPDDSVRVFSLSLRRLGVRVWRDPRSRRNGFAGLALKASNGSQAGVANFDTLGGNQGAPQAAPGDGWVG